MFRATMRPAGWVLGLAALLGLAANAYAEDAFYKGKRVTLLVNFAVGGPTDIEGRLFAKYIVRHVEGQPSVIVQEHGAAPAASSGPNISARWRPATAP